MPLIYPIAFAISTLAGAWFGNQLTEPMLSAQLPSSTAVFETSLASPITSSATSMTLSANSVRGGGSLSGYNCFTIDEGSAQAEFVCGTVSSTAVSSLSRGISPLTGTSTDSDLQFAHRRGANVKITDFPLIQILKAQNNGEDTLPNPLIYASTVTLTQDRHLATKKYVDDTAFSGAGVIDASATARGVVELATTLETASSTPTGSSGNLAIPASNATSTYNANTAALRVVVTDNSGKIDDDFIPSTAAPPTGSITAYSSTTAPTGWLLANGQAVSRTTYSALFAVIGTSYGAGDGSTTFNLPDIRGRTIVMASTTQTTADSVNLSRDTLGDVGTTTTHTMTASQMPAHTHTTSFENGGGGAAVNTGGNGNGGGGNTTSSSAGGGAAFNILDPYIVLNYIIKY